MTSRRAQDGERDALARALRGLGLTDEPDKYGDGIHSWRCEHPDRYGPCDCFEEAISYILAALREHLEPVWEYGIRPEDDDIPLGISPLPSRESAEVRAGNIRGGWVIVRRTRAGAWHDAPVSDPTATVPSDG